MAKQPNRKTKRQLKKDYDKTVYGWAGKKSARASARERESRASKAGAIRRYLRESAETKAEHVKYGRRPTGRPKSAGQERRMMAEIRGTSAGRNPLSALPVGKFVTVHAIQRENGQIDIYGA